MNVAQRTRSHRSRWTWSAGGALLSVLTLAGFVALRGSQRGLALGTPVSQWIASELLGQPAAYAYLAIWTALALMGFGWVLGRHNDDLWSASRTDPSTGLANRRLLQAEVADALGQHGRRGTPVSLLLIDVDGLKAFNDVMGHAAGDAALRLVAEAIRATSRASDLAARWGGDEFVLVARGTPAFGAIELADRLRATLRRLLQEDENSALPQVTVSIGIADVERAGCARAEALFFAADRALYQAKALGRDRVMVAPTAAALSRLSAATSPGLPRVQLRDAQRTGG
jgi:diguanylate cyclase (GGDEF)-like protein